jgi:hypothetical protein
MYLKLIQEAILSQLLLRVATFEYTGTPTANRIVTWDLPGTYLPILCHYYLYRLALAQSTTTREKRLAEFQKSKLYTPHLQTVPPKMNVWFLVKNDIVV